MLPTQPAHTGNSQGRTSTANLSASGPHGCQPHLSLPGFSQHSHHLALEVAWDTEAQLRPGPGDVGWSSLQTSGR